MSHNAHSYDSAAAGTKQFLAIALGEKFKFATRNFLGAFGLLKATRTLKRKIVSLMSPIARRHAFVQQANRQRMASVSYRCANSSDEIYFGKERVLVAGTGPHRVDVELCLAKALELAGCVLMPLGRAELIREFCGVAPRAGFRLWNNLCNPAEFRDQAESVVLSCGSLAELLDVRCSGVRVGGHAIASVRRGRRSGYLDFRAPSVRSSLTNALASSIAVTAAVRRILQELRPTLVVMDDTAYTPKGEILDVCTEANIPVIRWFPAHKSSTLILKRYNSSNREHDLYSLSDASWQTCRKMTWNESRRAELTRELRSSYARGDWFGLAGTQFNRRLLDAGEVRKRLDLDPSKKAAFIFTHIGWDASFGRGRDLFEGYDEWLVRTVQAACSNDKLQWVIKIHPSHVMKSYYVHRPAEEETLRRHIGRLPPHVSILPAESDISTFSLFPVMDYCLTVRGTAGIEAACHGIPVLTGGAGRYDRKGFTIDSATSGEYLERIANIQGIPRLSPAEIELAERYAYGLFLRRPLALSSVTIDYDQKHGIENFFRLIELNLQTRQDWEEASDLRAFTDWVLNSDEEDFLLPVPEDSIDYQESRPALAAAG